MVPNLPPLAPITTGDVRELKAVFVGDNRLAVNWGRGASIALEELLEPSIELVGRVTGDQFVLKTADVGHVGTLLPVRFYKWFRYFYENRERRRVYRWYLKLEKAFGARDFVSSDPVQTANEILARRNTYPYFSNLLKGIDAADALILDGDGDIIFTATPRRETLFLLAMIELGSRLGKDVFLVNTMIPDTQAVDCNSETVRYAKALFSKCRAISVRDPVSLRHAQSFLSHSDCIYLPDSLFAWSERYEHSGARTPPSRDLLLPNLESRRDGGTLDFSKPYICIGGGALSARDPERSVDSYCRLVAALQTLGLALYLTENDSPDSFLREVARRTGIGLLPAETPILPAGSVLANARLFVSGRYHPSILASLGGTPCIFLGSHAHKMGSIAQVLEYKDARQFEPNFSDADLVEIVSLAKAYLLEGEHLRDSIRRVAKKRSEEVRRLPDFILRHSKACTQSSSKRGSESI